jgi:hypothetical protein
MALYWTIDSRKRAIDVVADGEVSMADAMAFFDAVEGANALHYSKLLDGTRAHAAMTQEDLLSIIVRIRGLHALGTMGALAVVATAEQAQRIARLLGAAAAADRPMKVFDDVKLARRWLEAQPPRLP